MLLEELEPKIPKVPDSVIGKNNENPSVPHKCQVCIATRRSNMANEQDHTKKDPDFGKSVLAE